MSVTPISAANGAEPPRRRRRSTATAEFGSGRRESHDATAFYERFVAPEISTSTEVAPPGEVDVIHLHDARSMAMVPSDSVALVVTSPPYFAGKQYELSLGENGVPATYFEYLQLLTDVFAECKRVLEPGGRIAVNVANLGRKPYRSLSADITQILQDLGLLLRGEVIWWKGRAAGGSCAWGTFQGPANPVLRDVTERVVIASKGRFDRALKPKQRHAARLPSSATISREEFMEATTDLWEIAPERASRVGHPAPFPVELPERLIHLYTYDGDVVLDPFMGSGSTAVASVRTGRRYVGFDTDPAYVVLAHERIAEERHHLEQLDAAASPRTRVERSAVTDAATEVGDPITEAVRNGRTTSDLARILLTECGFAEVRPEVKPRGLGIELSFTAVDQTGEIWAFDVSGAFTTPQAGLVRSDTLWKALATASVFHESTPPGTPPTPLVLLTTSAPAKGTAGQRALRVVTGPDAPVADVIELLDVAGQERLRRYATAGRAALDA